MPKAFPKPIDRPKPIESAYRFSSEKAIIPKSGQPNQVRIRCQEGSVNQRMCQNSQGMYWLDAAFYRVRGLRHLG